jgi:hypothetical protein
MFLFQSAFALDLEVGAGIRDDFVDPGLTAVDLVGRGVSGPWSLDVGGFVGLTPTDPSALSLTMATLVNAGGGDDPFPFSGDIWGLHAGVGWGDAARVPHRLTGSPVVGAGVDVRRVYLAALTLRDGGPEADIVDVHEVMDAGAYVSGGVLMAVGEHVGARLEVTEHLRPEHAVDPARLGLRGDLALHLLYRF